MDSVKTYQKVDSSENNVSFGISRMEDIFEKRKGVVDEPHRHDFYTVLIVKQAKGVHKIDFHSYELGSNQVFFVSPGQVHQVMEERKSIGFSMVFSSQFLIENSIQLSFIDNLNLFQNYGETPPLEPDTQDFEKIVSFTNEIYSLHNSDSEMKELSIGSFLKLLLIACNNSCSLEISNFQIEESNHRIIIEFKQFVDKHYKKEHSTSFYAEKMNLSSDYLNRVIKSKIGKTTKEYIQSRIIIEAKRLLFFSTLSNKEIGYELGFTEPSNFSAFFKKTTGFSPSIFKKNEHIGFS